MTKYLKTISIAKCKIMQNVARRETSYSRYEIAKKCQSTCGHYNLNLKFHNKSTLPYLKSLLSQLLLRACPIDSDWLDLSSKVKFVLFFPFVYCSFKTQQSTIYHPLICCTCLNKYVSHLLNKNENGSAYTEKRNIHLLPDVA